MKVRTRFAPSPTGDLHLGSVRTALYSYLYARRHNGVFILRIEDTDAERSTEAFVQVILEGMQWLGLEHDEGPFYQTQRFDRYKIALQQLLTHKKAYYCNCSKERLDTMREQQLLNKQKPRYDGHCRDLNIQPFSIQPAVIRFCTPQSGEIVFDDQVYGRICIQNNELDDLIIARSDGTPTYNFTVVIDDWDMQITHVIRGDDHLNNTPRQIHIFEALGATPPVYAHLPMILGKDGKRYSKRHGAASVLQFREEGYLPHALLNYLVRLGWSYGDQEIFSRQEMCNLFNLEAVQKSPAAFDIEKLQWLNQHYLKSLSPAEIAPYLAWHMQALDINIQEGPSLEEIIKAQAERSKTLREMAMKSYFFYSHTLQYDEKAVAKNFVPELSAAFRILKEKLADCVNWDREAIHHLINETAETFSLNLGKLAQPVRIAVTGGTISPPIDITLQLLGRDKTLSRLQYAADNFFN